MNLTEQIKQQIEAALPEAQVSVEDPNNDGTHLQATIISSSFEGKNRIEQHRMVYAALGDAFSTNLHALQISTKIPKKD